jgi:hypothetical protein
VIEFVTVHSLRETFSAYYIGAASTDDCVYRRNQASLQALPAFVRLLTENGFTEFNRADSIGVVSYKRTGNMLEGNNHD